MSRARDIRREEELLHAAELAAVIMRELIMIRTTPPLLVEKAQPFLDRLLAAIEAYRVAEEDEIA